MTPPRGVEQRITWFLNHRPSGPGMCAQHTWHSMGGDRGNPPAWGAGNANQVYQKVLDSGRYWKGDPPRGSFVVWRYGRNGHMALSLGGGRIATTDPSGKRGGVGIEDIRYPERTWGANDRDRIYSDQYAGVRIPMDDEEDDMPLSDNDVERIAKAVWAFQIGGQGAKMRAMVRDTYEATTGRDSRTAEEDES